MSNSPQNKPAANGSSKPDIEFTTSNIGRWASKQENPFAEQNRKTAAKKRARAEKRQKARPIVIVTIAAIVAIVAALIGLIALISYFVNNKLPDDISTGSTGADQVQEGAQKVYDDVLAKFYNQHNGTRPATKEEIDEAIQAVTDYYDRRGQSASSDAQKFDLVILEIELFNNNNQPEAVINAAEKASGMVDSMSDHQKSIYWGMLMNAYFNVGNPDEANKYLELLNQLPSDGVEVEG